MNEQQQDIVAGYAALLELNKKMIEIAVAGEWENLVEMKSEHLCQVETLMSIEYDVAVNDAFREAKRAVLIQIAATEQELRDRLQLRRDELSGAISQARSQRRVKKAYEKAAIC